MTYLKIVFQSENTFKTFNVYYKLLNNSVINKFIELINKINLEYFIETRYNNFCINVGNLHEIKNNKYNELMKNIELFENENNNNFIFHNKFEFNNINQNILNALHTEFEQYLVIFTNENCILTSKDNIKNIQLKNIFNENNIILYLNNINCLIHNLESLLLNNNSNYITSGYYSTYLYSELFIDPIKLSDNEYNLFTVDIKWGELLLGYGTTGKSLYHIFKDNDIELLKKKFNLSPQEFITPNIMGMFLETDENHYNDFQKWCFDNNIKELYNIDVNDIKNSNGYIKLGDLVYENSREEFLSNLINYKNIINFSICENI